MSININYPIKKSDVDGYFSVSYETIDAIKNKIKILLNTQSGTRIFNSNFGINYRKYLFEPNVESLGESLQDEIKIKLQTYIPEVSISKVDIFVEDTNSDNFYNALSVNIGFSYFNTNIAETVSVDLNKLKIEGI